MGLCFSYQQTKDLELRWSSLFSLLVPPASGGSIVNDADGVAKGGDVMAPSLGDPKPLLSPPPDPTQGRKKKHKTPKPTYESKAVQVDLGSTGTSSAPNPNSNPNTNPNPVPTLARPITPPPRSVATPNHATRSPNDNTNSDTLAQEERRRKREERRAARNAHNEDKLKLELNLKSPSEYLDDRCKMDVHIFKGFDAGKKCLVLDIDYTIFDHKSDFELAPEYKRPYLHEFLKTCSSHYNIVIWSATAFYHVHTKMDKLQLLNHPDFQICCALSKDHMIPHTFSVKRKTFVQDIKPLALLWRKFPDFFDHCNTIHIDDVAENFALNPRNGLRIDPFREALVYRQTDKELFYLTLYLSIIAALPSLSALDHYKWKDYVINALWDAQTAFVLPSFTSPEPASALLLQQHEQAMILKYSLKEKMKEREREERARERETEERVKREQEKAGQGIRVNHSTSKGSGTLVEVTEMITPLVAMEVVVAEVEGVADEATKGVWKAAMDEPTNLLRGTEGLEQVVGMEEEEHWEQAEPTVDDNELGMGGAEEPLDVQILLSTALVDTSKEQVVHEDGRDTGDWDKREWSQEINAQAVF